MPGLLIKNVPKTIHTRLKRDAARNHRSLTRHALALIEEALDRHAHEPLVLPKPIRPARPITALDIKQAIGDGRA